MGSGLLIPLTHLKTLGKWNKKQKIESFNWKKTYKNTPSYQPSWSKYIGVLTSCRTRTSKNEDMIIVPTMVDPTAGSLFVSASCAYLEEGYNATSTDAQRQRKAESKAAAILEHMLLQSIRESGANRGPMKF